MNIKDTNVDCGEKLNIKLNTFFAKLSDIRKKNKTKIMADSWTKAAETQEQAEIQQLVSFETISH